VDLLLEATFRAERDHFWFRGFRRFTRPLLLRAAPERARTRILDCGCGTGANLSVLEEFGTPFGLDLTWTGLRFAHQAGQRRLARATAAQLPFPGGTFDLVTSFDVLQVLPGDAEREAANEMSRVLKPGGVAIVNVSAFDTLRGNHSVLSYEVRRYTRPRLRSLLERAGFTIERLTYTNMTLMPALLLLRTAQRIVGLAPPEKAEREITVPATPVNWILSSLLGVEAQIARRIPLPFGSSLLCLARKPA
jgi:SAM-dependent methyltransferase